MKLPILLTALVLAPVLALHAVEPAAKPNIIVILADDLGYADTGIYGGNKNKQTPRIDGLAQGGARFLNGYVSGPVCSPTRAGLLTGRYQQRFGFEANGEGGKTPEEDIQRSMDKGQTTFPQRMKALGYATGMIGKWHLGEPEGYRPIDRGFDEFFGIYPYGVDRGKKIPSGQLPAPLYRGTEEVPTPANFMNAFADESLAFLERHRGRPFFLYLPFTAIHGKQVGAEPWLGRTDPSLPMPQRKRIADIAQLDEIVGRILDKLRELGLEENTLIFFLSDNGAGTERDNHPFRGTKWTLWDGGIHVPFVASWKGRFPAGQVLAQPVIQLDILPTALAAAGQPAGPEDKLDGVNILPLLEGKTTAAPHQALFWRFGIQSAVRQGDWKLTQVEPEQPPRLYDLEKDPGESRDLAAENPAKVAELQKLWDKWNQGNVAPRWIDPRWDIRVAKSKEEAQAKAEAQGATKPGEK